MVRQTSWMTKYLRVLVRDHSSLAFGWYDVLCLLLLENTISMTLKDTADVTDGFCDTSGDKTTREGAPYSILDRQVQLGDGEEGEDGEECDVGSHVRDVRVPAIFFDAACGQGAKTAIESHFVRYE